MIITSEVSFRRVVFKICRFNEIYHHHSLVDIHTFPVGSPYQLPFHSHRQLADAESVHLNPQLMNLLKTYAYNRHKQMHVPLSEQQSQATERVTHDLSNTLKTILRI